MTETKKSIYQKIATVQATIGAIEKDKTNPAFRGAKYFDVNTLAERIIPLLAEQNILLTTPVTTLSGRTAVTLNLHDLDSGKEVDAGSAFIPDNLDAQKMGGAITYFRRYLVVSYFYLQAEDDDGNTAGQVQRAGYTPSGAPTAARKRTEGFQKAQDAAEHDIPTIIMDEDEFIN